MTEINGNTVIAVTAKQLLWSVVGGAILLVGGIWAVVAFSVSNLQDDVSDIRTAVTTAQDRTVTTHQYATSADGELRAEISGLTAELRTTNAGLSNLAASVTGLNESIRAVDVRLARSIERQEAFERSVLVRLGPVGIDQTKYESGLPWGKSQDEILRAISTGGDPLTDWYKFTTQR